MIVNITHPLAPAIYAKETFGEKMTDVEDVIIGSTNASLFAYVADGRNGLKVIQLTSPESQPNFYGFSPAPKPELIAWAQTPSPAVALSRGSIVIAVSMKPGTDVIFPDALDRPFTRRQKWAAFTGPKALPFKVLDLGHAGIANAAAIERRLRPCAPRSLREQNYRNQRRRQPYLPP